MRRCTTVLVSGLGNAMYEARQRSEREFRYQGLTDEELIGRIVKRDEEIDSLRRIHVSGHRAAEYHMRRQFLEYEEKAQLYEEKVNKTSLDAITECRHRLRAIRAKYDQEYRDKATVSFACLVGCVVYYLYGKFYYGAPYHAQNKTAYYGSVKFGNFLSSPKLYSRHVLTRWEQEQAAKEQKQKELEAAAFGAVPPSALHTVPKV